MKNFIKALSIIFIIAIISAVSLCFVGCKNADKVELEKETGKIENVVISCDSTPTLSLSSVSEAGETNTRTLTAVVSEDTDDLADKTLVWSLAFDDPNAEWAVGKTITDYVTIAPSEDTHSCTVTLVQPFGETIRVVVTAKNNPDATASATVDYLKRVTGFKGASVGSGSTAGSITLCYNAQTDSDKKSFFSFTGFEEGIGSLSGYIKISRVNIKMSDMIYNGSKSAIGFNDSTAAGTVYYQSITCPISLYSIGSGAPINILSTSVENPLYKSFSFICPIFNGSDVQGSFVGGNPATAIPLSKKLNDYLIKNDGALICGCTLSIDVEVYDIKDNLYQSETLTIGDYLFTASKLTALLQVNGVSMTPSAISF